MCGGAELIGGGRSRRLVRSRFFVERPSQLCDRRARMFERARNARALGARPRTAFVLRGEINLHRSERRGRRSGRNHGTVAHRSKLFFERLRARFERRCLRCRGDVGVEVAAPPSG